MQKAYVSRLAETFLGSLHHVSYLLDLGCGDGTWSQVLSELADHVVGIDIAKFSQWRAKVKPNVIYVLCDARYLPFRSASFEVVFEKDALHHVRDISQAASEINRVAKDKVILIESNRYDPLTLVHMTMIRGHEHFSEARFRELASVLGASTVLMKREDHFFVLPSCTLLKWFCALENAFERLPLVRKFVNYNIAVVSKA